VLSSVLFSFLFPEILNSSFDLVNDSSPGDVVLFPLFPFIVS